jgi:hypothetical protein
MRFKTLVQYSEKLRKVSSRNAKIDIIINLMRKLKKEEAGIGVTYISGKTVQGKINIVWNRLNELYEMRSQPTSSPELLEVNDYLERASQSRGREKVEVLSPLFRRFSKP